MNAPATRDGWGDRLGPIVVKELRQGLRGKSFAVFFGLLLLACLVISMVAVGQAPRGRSQLGPQTLLAYLVALAVVSFFVTPFVAFRSLLREREDGTWSLLVLTGLGGRSIVRGKWLSAMSQGALYASACAPFVLFSYFLNGVSLFQVAVPLLASFVWSSFVTTVALGLASQANSSTARTGSTLSTLAVLAIATVLGISYLGVVAMEGGGSLRHERTFQIFTGLLIVVALGSSRLALEGSAAALALPSEAASRGPRQALVTFVGLMMLGLLPLVAIFEPSPKVPVMGTVLCSLYLVVVGFFALGEGEGWPRRYAQDGWLKPGLRRGYALMVTLLTGCGVLWALLFCRSDDPERYQAVLVAAPAYPLLYLSLAVIGGKLSWLRKLGQPIASRAAFLALVTLGVATSPLISLAARGSVEWRGAHLLNPIFGLAAAFDDGRRPLLDNGRVLTLAVVTAVSVALAFVVLARGDVERET